MIKKKIVKVATVPESLNVLLKGQLKFLSKYFEIIAVTGSGVHLDEVKEREQVVVEPIEMKRRISLIKDFISLIYLYRFFKKEKPYIVHSITPKAGLLSMLAAKFAGVPVRMHTFTGLIFPYKTGFFQKLLIFMDKILCWSATNVYPEGEGVKKDLIKYRITKKVLKVIGNGNINGIDTAFFEPEQISEEETLKLKAQLDIAKDDFVFIFVGRLVKDKGINELITAFTNLNLSKTKLLLVGALESDLDPLLPETLTEIEENINIINVGYQSDVRPYFKVANVLVFPSYREGFPNVVMQAGAMELPAIVSNINGCNEIIEEGKNGLIIPVKNSKVIEEAMRKVYQEKSLFDQLKSNARQMIVSRYEQKIIWEAIRNEYENLEHV
ncbi:glycosyl transferase family 1 [Flavobacterium covae]|uniref:glycosyltransferase family 4 protein n=1 Tax=Flavobacterium covae TaxID=2906076 RepID=UPI0007C1D738|nr:glycosyltransferase family 4 protein [Flavobacterium covae]AND64630.1 glycosyl transferase family 1 [Flavobacterium covae]